MDVNKKKGKRKEYLQSCCGHFHSPLNTQKAKRQQPENAVIYALLYVNGFYKQVKHLFHNKPQKKNSNNIGFTAKLNKSYVYQ